MKLVIRWAVVWSIFVSVAFGQETNLSDSYYHFSLAQLAELNQDLPLAQEEFEKALSADPDSASLRTEYAKVLALAGNTSRAVEECLRALELDENLVDGHYLLGRIYMNYRSQEGMQEKALAEFEKVLVLDPEHLGGLNDSAEILWDLKRYEQAAERFSRFRQVDPTSIRTYFLEAQALTELGDLDRAISVLEEGLSIRGDIPDYLFMLAQLYQQKERFEDAVEIFRSVLDRTPDPRFMEGLAKSLIGMGDGKGAVPLLERLIKLYPDRVDLKLELSRAHRIENNLPEAVKILEGVCEKDPSNLQAAFDLARIWAASGEQEKAIQKLEFLVETPGNGAEDYKDVFRTHLGLLYEDTGRPDDAVKVLREVFDANPGEAEAGIRLFYAFKSAAQNEEGLNLTSELMKEHGENPFVVIAHAQALEAVGEFSKAVSLLQERVASSSDSEILSLALSQIYLVRKEFVLARSVVEEALSKSSENHRLRFQLGAIFEREKNFDAAEKEFKKVLGVNPDDADTLNYLGYMLADRGVRLPEALGYIQRALALAPNNAAYLDSLGWTYFMMNELDEAENYLAKAAMINRTDPVIFEHLGDLYKKRGALERAREFYEKSIQRAEEEEDSERVKEKLEKLPGN